MFDECVDFRWKNGAFDPTSARWQRVVLDLFSNLDFFILFHFLIFFSLFCFFSIFWDLFEQRHGWHGK